jgi:hypothetical protein
VHRAQHRLADVPAPLGDSLRRSVLDADDQLEAQAADRVECPARQLPERLAGDAAAARVGDDHVAELDRAGLAVDRRRPGAAEEGTVVCVDDGEDLAGAGGAARLRRFQPGAGEAGRRGDGNAREALDVRVGEEGRKPVQVRLAQRLEPDAGQG